jgi:phage baseplate assembly protein gpV
MNDLVAVPMSRGGSKKVVITIGHDGKVSLDADSLTLTAENVKIDGELEVTGDAKFLTKTAGVTFSSHIHPTPVGSSSPPNPDPA